MAIIINPNEWSVEEIQVMYRTLGTKFEINDGKIIDYGREDD